MKDSQGKVKPPQPNLQDKGMSREANTTNDSGLAGWQGAEDPRPKIEKGINLSYFT